MIDISCIMLSRKIALRITARSTTECKLGVSDKSVTVGAAEVKSLKTLPKNSH